MGLKLSLEGKSQCLFLELRNEEMLKEHYETSTMIRNDVTSPHAEIIIIS